MHYKNATGSEAIKSNEHAHAETYAIIIRLQLWRHRSGAWRNSTQGARGQGPQLVQGASTISHQEANEGVAVASLERTCNTPTAIAFSRLDIGNRPLHVSSDLQAVINFLRPTASRTLFPFQSPVEFSRCHGHWHPNCCRYPLHCGSIALMSGPIWPSCQLLQPHLGETSPQNGWNGLPSYPGHTLEATPPSTRPGYKG